MSMPWDLYPPEPADVPPEPPPTPPVEPTPPRNPYPPDVPPTPNVPARPGTDAAALGHAMGEAFAQALREGMPHVKEQAIAYARDTIGATVRGDRVDHANPTITATTSQGRKLVVADAKSRSWRTLVQGLAIDLTFALVATLAILADMDPFVEETWLLFGALLVKTVIQTIAAYIMRMRVTPTIHTKGEEMALMPVPRPLTEKEQEDAGLNWAG